jgi:hypothetical protein
VNYRQFSRQVETMPFHPSFTKARRRAQEYLATHEPPDWSALEGRLQAFASEPVFTAVQASSTAHQAAMGTLNLGRALGRVKAADDAEEDRSADATTDKIEDSEWDEVVTKVDKAWKAADAADDAVIELIRAELQGRGRPLGDWHPGPD